MKNLAIIGAGGWGTALAIRLAQNAERIRLWVFEPELCASLRSSRTNDLYLPGFFIPENVEPTTDLGAALQGSEVILTVAPSHHVRSIYQRMLPILCADPDRDRPTHDVWADCQGVTPDQAKYKIPIL